MTSLKHLACAGLLTLAAAPAFACDPVYAYRYQMDDAAYKMELNGVLIAANAEPGDYFGGGPFIQWMVEGENTLTVSMDQGGVEISVIQACEGDFDGETLVEAKLGAGESRDLTFFVEGAPPAVYDDAEQSDAGLREALAALKASVEARDADRYWEMHKGLRATAAQMGFPEEALKGMMMESVAKGEPAYREDVTFKPVLNGRVWQVLAADGEPPIKLELKVDGGTNLFDTGGYWAKMDGQWTVVGN